MNCRLRLAAALVVCSGLTVVACGGASKPSNLAEANVAIEGDAEEDMPAPPAKEADEAAAEAPSAGSGAAGGVIALAPMKFTPAKKDKSVAFKSLELKGDGTVLIDGKPAATIKGDEVDSAGGTSMLTVGVDGSLVGNGVKPGMKFDGDDLVTDTGVRLSVGDDGTITASKNDKAEVLGTAENGAASRRAALVVAVLWMNVPTDVKGAAKK